MPLRSRNLNRGVNREEPNAGSPFRPRAGMPRAVNAREFVERMGRRPFLRYQDLNFWLGQQDDPRLLQLFSTQEQLTLKDLEAMVRDKLRALAPTPENLPTILQGLKLLWAEDLGPKFCPVDVTSQVGPPLP